ncbi:hypothetical protein BDZ89DRAFT_1067624 [Hymenopellis radicata]|nr:hypothetical protein BDZ89DRAFT_1067624 [Hymenopellis radicata]
MTDYCRERGTSKTQEVVAVVGSHLEQSREHLPNCLKKLSSSVELPPTCSNTGRENVPE